jgi:predicted nucleic acid-binding protein
VEQVSRGDLWVTAITHIEQLQGRFQQIVTADSADRLLQAWERLGATEQWFASKQILPVDASAATTFDALRAAKLGKLGRKDLLIAAIVLSRNLVLITRDFQRVPGLRIEDWSR